MKTKHLLALALLLCGVTPLLPAQDAAPAAPPAAEPRRQIRNITAPVASEPQPEPQPPPKREQREIKTADMHDIEFDSQGNIRFTAGDTKYVFYFDGSTPATAFPAAIALLGELRKVEKFRITFWSSRVSADGKRIEFHDVNIAVGDLK